MQTSNLADMVLKLINFVLLTVEQAAAPSKWVPPTLRPRLDACAESFRS